MFGQIRKSCRSYHYCLQDFSLEEILKSHIKDCFKIYGKQTIKMPKKTEYIKSKNKVTIHDLCKF